ncbi:MAG: hypothetical protein IJJ34_02570 [Clostridia bacterium]|nr:hypothetical protein [Clostridia bacterium]
MSEEMTIIADPAKEAKEAAAKPVSQPAAQTQTANTQAQPKTAAPTRIPVPQPVQPADDKQTHILLEEMVRTQKKTFRRQRVIMYAMLGIFLVVLVSAAILVPNAVKLMNRAGDAVDRIDTLAVDMQGAVENINVAVDSVNTVVVDNTQDISEALQNINNVDFETLNKAILDLSDTVEPMARFFKLLGN